MNRLYLWCRRALWLVAVWLIGAAAGRSLRHYYGGNAWPPPSRLLGVALLLLAAGTVGGILLIAVSWHGLFIGAGVAAAAWSMAFVDAIPATRKICGGDAVNGCEHVQSIEWMFLLVVSYAPVLIAFLAGRFAWQQRVPLSRPTRPTFGSLNLGSPLNAFRRPSR